MNKTSLVIVLIILVITIISRHNGCSGQESLPNSPTINVPNKPVVIPKPVLESNIVYDDLEKAIILASIHERNIVVIFSADWCPYCVKLKKQTDNLQSLKQYIVCILDVDKKDKNHKAINLLRPKSLPTSIIIDKNSKELSRITGYRERDYITWLNKF
jgi:thioredoxin-related protein